jgi:hypothetical protein
LSYLKRFLDVSPPEGPEVGSVATFPEICPENLTTHPSVSVGLDESHYVDETPRELAQPSRILATEPTKPDQSTGSVGHSIQKCAEIEVHRTQWGTIAYCTPDDPGDVLLGPILGELHRHGSTPAIPSRSTARLEGLHGTRWS